MPILKFPDYEECPLCGDDVDVKPDENGYYYDGQNVRCANTECPAIGYICADPENVFIQWHDLIKENGEWIRNPEWEEFELKSQE